MGETRTDVLKKIENELENREISSKLIGAMGTGRKNRGQLINQMQLDVKKMKKEVRNIKINTTTREEIINNFSNKVKENGGNVFFADKGEDAINYVLEVAKRTKTRLITKSKSLTSEEIEFNQGIEKEGIKIVETDLGELICQLNNEIPIHLVMPAAHKNTQDIADLFSKEYGMNIEANPEEILKVVRKKLRPIFLEADMGVTGGNIGVAETGSIVIETNEGNGRLVASVPDVHIVLIGIEKIVDNWESASKLIPAHSISATGQRMTVYVSIITQHNPIAGDKKNREYHVILLDNGRTKMSKDEWFKDALNCIRCGACMNICPTYGVVGGYTFGHIYPGPIGIPWTEQVHGTDKTAYSHLCISCGLCKEICPVDIDIPMMIAKVKETENSLNGKLGINNFLSKSDSLARSASQTAPLSNWLLKNNIVRYFMEKFIGIDRRRTLPVFHRDKLSDRIDELKQGTGESGKIIFFSDVYAEYNDPELGLRAIKLLRKLGYKVILPKLEWSGMPYISYGEIEKATELANKNIDILKSYVDDGYQIVSTEPTAIYVLKDIYPTLVKSKESSNIAKNTRSVFEIALPKINSLKLTKTIEMNETIGYHIPCHDRAFNNSKATIKFLEKSGYNVKIIETGTCCGMAGTFGLKHGVLGYELANVVGEDLFKLFIESKCKVIATESSVCSTQLYEGTGIRVVNPLHLIECK